MRNIYIVLIQSPTLPAKIIRLFKRKDKYTHAAISMDKELHYMFSFGRRWEYSPFIGCFKQEKIHEGVYGKCAELPGVILELMVTEEQYDKATSELERFISNGNLFKYNYMGLIYNFLKLNYKQNYRFFCSEFVYYILNESGISDLNIPRVFVSPQELLKLSNTVVYEGNLKIYPSYDLIYNNNKSNKKEKQSWLRKIRQYMFVQIAANRLQNGLDAVRIAINGILCRKKIILLLSFLKGREIKK